MGLRRAKTISFRLTVSSYEKMFEHFQEPIAVMIRKFIEEESDAVLLGEREKTAFVKRRYPEKTVEFSVGVYPETVAQIAAIREFYGLPSNNEAVRIAIRNGLRNMKTS